MDREETVMSNKPNSMDNIRNANQAIEIKLNQLEKQVWLLRIHEELNKKDDVSNCSQFFVNLSTYGLNDA